MAQQVCPECGAATEVGEEFCGQCGVGNKPDRKFCRRCGRDLSEAVVARVPWWRRLLARRPKPVRVAGTRPTVRTRRRIPGRLLVLVLVGALLVAGGVFGRGYVRGAYEAVLDRVKNVAEVAPADARSPQPRPRHLADASWDGDPNSYWSPQGSGKGARLTIFLDKPSRVVYLKIFPGVSSTDKGKWRAVGRPQQITALITTHDDEPITKTLEFKNTMGDVDFRIATSNVTEIRLTIDSSYGPAATKGTAIAEVELYVRK